MYGCVCEGGRGGGERRVKLREVGVMGEAG